MHKQIPILILLNIGLSLNMLAQPEVNYEEEAIKPYLLPELLTLENGKKIKNIVGWEKERRPEILNSFRDQVYGVIPAGISPSAVRVIEQSDAALDNQAIRRQVAIIFRTQGREITINVLLYLPKNVQSPPIFVGYNFYGNHTTIDDHDVIIANSWVLNDPGLEITDNQATEAGRGQRSNRWPIKKIISEGFGIATVCYGDVDPDKNDFSDGIHPFFYKEGQSEPNDNEWGSISAWAWGYSKILDYLKNDGPTSDSKFIVFGHSRLGKTSLWAGALDDRFDMVIANNSGCGGAAIFRRQYGETAAIINDYFPHWFNKNFKKYSNNEHSLPIDQHMLIALIAPRPVYITSAEDDKWADPKGEYLSGYHASPVYELYGKQGLVSDALPPTNEPVHKTIGYHIRTGIHDVTAYDWEQFIKFAREHLDE